MSVSQEIQQHWQQFIAKNETATYEEWIKSLHPEEASEGLLGMGDIVIDPKFYQEGNDHLKFWNDHLDSKRSPVQGSSPSPQNGDEAFVGFDLLSGDGENDSQASPQSVPRQTISTLAPGEDLMKFN